MKKEELLKLENQLCFPLYACSREIIKAYYPLLRKLDLTYTQYLVMLVLWEADGQTVKEIGERLKLDSGTLTPLLKRLETVGYVSRRRGREDERQVIIHLTAEGRALSEKAAEIPTALGCAMGAEFAEISELREHLLTLRDRLAEAGCAVGEAEG